MWKAENGKQYYLCGLDTNIVSELLKQRETIGKNFIVIYSADKYAPCFSIYTIAELRRRKDVFESFLDVFSIYPCFLLKYHDQLFMDELNSYPDPSIVDCKLHAFSLMNSDQNYNLRNFLDLVFADPQIQKAIDEWRAKQESVLQSMFELKKNFSPKNLTANANDSERFIKEAGLQQIMIRDSVWSKKMMDSGKKPNIHHFPSLKMMLYTIYYRLYDQNRVPEYQDVADICISASVPYLDVSLVESFQAEILKKVKSRDKFIGHIKISTLRELRTTSKQKVA